MAIKEEIDQAKIGKKDERLVGWDYIRKQKMNTNYPPMRARGAKENQYSGAYARYYNGTVKWFLLVVIVIVIIGTKIIGLW